MLIHTFVVVILDEIVHNSTNLDVRCLFRAQSWPCLFRTVCSVFISFIIRTANFTCIGYWVISFHRWVNYYFNYVSSHVWGRQLWFILKYTGNCFDGFFLIRHRLIKVWVDSCIFAHRPLEKKCFFLTKNNRIISSLERNKLESKLHKCGSRSIVCCLIRSNSQGELCISQFMYQIEFSWTEICPNANRSWCVRVKCLALTYYI